MNLWQLGIDPDSPYNDLPARWDRVKLDVRAWWGRFIKPRVPANLAEAPLFMRDWLILIYCNDHFDRIQPLRVWRITDELRVWRRSPILPWRKYPYIDVGFPANGSSYYILYNSPPMTDSYSGRQLEGTEIANLIVRNLEEARQPDPWFKPGTVGPMEGLVSAQRRMSTAERDGLAHMMINAPFLG